MKCKVVRNRITIPAEIRDAINLKDSDYLDVKLDVENKNIVIDISDRDISMSNNKKVTKTKKTPKKVDEKVRASCKKIEANYMDADKLYKAYYSPCGLLVRTKNSYVKSACERCQGKLVKEYEDRIDVQCGYVDKKAIRDEIVYEITKRVHPEIENVKKQRKEEMETVTNNIKEAVKVIDKKVKKLNKKDKPKRRTADNTTIKPIRAGKDMLLKCKECGQLVKSGFYVDKDILCKKCTVDDFKKYMKKRGK